MREACVRHRIVGPSVMNEVGVRTAGRGQCLRKQFQYSENAIAASAIFISFIGIAPNAEY